MHGIMNIKFTKPTTHLNNNKSQLPVSFCVNKSSYTETINAPILKQRCFYNRPFMLWSMCRDFCNFTVLLATCPCPGCVTWIPLNWQFTNKATLLVPDTSKVASGRTWSFQKG